MAKKKKSGTRPAARPAANSKPKKPASAAKAAKAPASVKKTGKPAAAKGKSVTATPKSGKPAKVSKPVTALPPKTTVTTAKTAPPKPVAPPAPMPSSRQAPSMTEAPSNGDFHMIPIEDLRKVKSGLSAKDLHHFRDLLMEKRAEIVGDVKAMHDGARSNSGGNLSHMPVHMADIGSDNYEQEFTLGLVESEAKLLREIDEALLRIREGIYGVCMVSGKPIARPRLEAKPWAKFSIEVAREMEKRGVH